MKNKMSYVFKIGLIMAFSLILLSGCGAKPYSYPYEQASKLGSFSNAAVDNGATTSLFAKDLAVADKDVGSAELSSTQDIGAGLFEINGAVTGFSKNVHQQFYPASITKIMTALVALKNADLDDEIIVSGIAAGITESGATLSGLKAGDTLTMEQALNALLIYSANDAAVAIAEHIGGSVASFADMMNAEAKRLGATNSNFVNPHGLHDENHYTTAYDIYLIFNEAIKYQAFVDIISQDKYETTFQNRNGEPKKFDFVTTNLFKTGNYKTPESVIVVGGKTGTTKTAGNCLIILSKNSSGKDYISIIMHSDTKDTLYKDMIKLLEMEK